MVELNVWERELLGVIQEKAPREYNKLRRKAGNLLRKKVRNLTPKVTGDLRKSYRVKLQRRDEVFVYTTKFYARLVEEGHPIVRYTRERDNGRVRRAKHVVGFVPGKFYLRKALEEMEGELPELVYEFLARVGKEMGFDVTR